MPAMRQILAAKPRLKRDRQMLEQKGRSLQDKKDRHKLEKKDENFITAINKSGCRGGQMSRPAGALLAPA